MSLFNGIGRIRYIFDNTLYLAVLVTLFFFLPSIVLLVLHKKGLSGIETAPEGCRRLGLQGHCNLEDEHDERYSQSGSRSEKTSWKIKSLWIYPVKSCRGIELSRSVVTGRGMDYDRQFSFAQLVSKSPAGVEETGKKTAKQTWKFITQRTFPLMANIKTEVWVPDPAYSRNHPNLQSEGVILLKFPSYRQDAGFWEKMHHMSVFSGRKPEKTVRIPFNPTKEQVAANGYVVEDMEIWRNSPPSLRIASTQNSDSWIEELRSYLGLKHHLALFRVRDPREVYRCAPRRAELGYQSTIGFQDAYPLHILNLASVHDVAENMEQSAPRLGARNFRPNIVISGGDAYTEDSWKRIKIDEYMYHVACRTVRCLLPNVNPATGVRHKSEPNRTLKSIRRIDEGDPKNACLGMQMVPALQTSIINVGDAITVLETGEHFYIKQ